MSSIHFFMGKGGVGKSTLSTLTAFHLAMKGSRVLLVSLDPAHNLSHILKKKLGHRERKIRENLSVREIDEKRMISDYLKDLEVHLARVYSYHRAFNLEKHFSIIRHSPAIEEYSLLMAFRDTIRDHGNMDHIIFDMPPTALSLKFFRLPRLSLLWLEKIQDLRRNIIERKEIITKIKFGKKVLERDKVLNRIDAAIADYHGIEGVFRDRNRTRINLVVNPEGLSLAESVNIHGELGEAGLSPRAVVLNRYCSIQDREPVARAFDRRDIPCIPLAPEALIGPRALEDFARQNREALTLITGL